MIIVTAIVDKGASKPMDRLLVADAIGRTPSSSEFKRLLSSSRAYGLTVGTEKADNVAPTDLGLKIAKPLTSDEALHAKVQACLNVEIIGKLWQQFNRQKLPDAKFLKNTLERTYGLSAEHADEFAALAVANAQFCGILQDISGSKYIRMEEPRADAASTSGPPVEIENDEPDRSELDDPVVFTFPPVADAPVVPQVIEKKPKLFLAHGKNMKPLDELKKILDDLSIQYVVAIDEPHAGRPISGKVAELMNECTAGIFIFTKDELFYKKQQDGEFTETWRPSENVVYELGAAGILWEKKIIILREDGVNFPSDFSDLGYITFKPGELGMKAMEIVKELLTFKLLKLQAA
ncbi:MAG: TIR domain-containing protein [Brevundimonas sp.]